MTVDLSVLAGGAGNDTLVAATAAPQGDVFNYQARLCAGRGDRLRTPQRRRHPHVVSIQGFGVTTFGQLQTAK